MIQPHETERSPFTFTESEFVQQAPVKHQHAVLCKISIGEGLWQLLYITQRPELLPFKFWVRRLPSEVETMTCELCGEQLLSRYAFSVAAGYITSQLCHNVSEEQSAKRRSSVSVSVGRPLSSSRGNDTSEQMIQTTPAKKRWWCVREKLDRKGSLASCLLLYRSKPAPGVDLFAVYRQRFNLYYNKTLNVVNRAGQKMSSQRDGECVWAGSRYWWGDEAAM